MLLAHEFEEFLSEGAESGVWLRLNPPRPLSDEEQPLIGGLLAREFRGRDQLRRQVPSAHVVAEAVEGDPSIKMSPSRDPSLAATVLARVPVEAMGRDATGNDVTVLLHVVGGFLAELEILGSDGRPVMLPSPPSLVVY